MLPSCKLAGAEFAGLENDGPRKKNNNSWQLQDHEIDGSNRSPGMCKTWKMTDLKWLQTTSHIGLAHFSYDVTNTAL